MRKRWLHVSEKYLGSSFLFIPRIPQGIDIHLEDTTIARICVSDSIDRCIMGIYGEPNPRKLSQFWVYELRGDVVRPTIKQVPDRARTNEHWFIHPTIGNLIRP